MHKGLTRATLGVLGAALLTGSVFAAGPTLKQIPTVVITDKHQADLLSVLNPNVYDFESPTTGHIYQFTGALDLVTYADFENNLEAELQTVKYMFTEGPAATPLTGAARTISINTDLGEETVPDYAAITDVSNTRNVWDNRTLDFVSELRDGVDPGGNFDDATDLNLYVASTDPTTNGAVDMKTFTVITTNDTSLYDGDQLTSTSVWTPLTCVEDFDSWYTQAFNQLFDWTDVPIDIPGTGWNATATATTTVTTYVAQDIFGTDVDWSTTGTTDLDISTYASTGNTAGYAPHYRAWLSWRRDFGDVAETASVTAGDLVMVRWELSNTTPRRLAPADSPKLPSVRCRVGEATTLAAGQASDEFAIWGVNHIVTGTEKHRSWYYAHADGDIGFFFDLFTLWDQDGLENPPGTQVGYEAIDCTYVLSKIEALKMDPSELTSKTVLLNHGAANFTIADSSSPPTSPAPSAFDAAVWDDRVIQEGGAANRPFSVNITADSITCSLTQGDGSVLASVDTLNYTAATGYTKEIISGVTNDQLIRLDAWLSSPQGATADNNLFTYRIGLQTDAYGISGSGSFSLYATQGRTSWMTFEGTNRDQPDVGLAVSPKVALETGAKQYSVFMEPSLRATGATTIDVRPAIDVYSFPVFERGASGGAINEDTYLEPYKEGSLVINRIAVTTYAIPGDAGTVDAACAP